MGVWHFEKPLCSSILAFRRKETTEFTPSAISRIMVRTILLLAIVMAKVDLLILPKEFVSCNLKHFQNVNQGFSSLNSSYN